MLKISIIFNPSLSIKINYHNFSLKIYQHVLENAFTELHPKYGVNTCGTMHDTPVKKIHYLDMGFGSLEKLNVEESRK